MCLAAVLVISCATCFLDHLLADAAFIRSVSFCCWGGSRLLSIQTEMSKVMLTIEYIKDCSTFIWHNFVVKCRGTAWSETNIAIRSMQK